MNTYSFPELFPTLTSYTDLTPRAVAMVLGDCPTDLSAYEPVTSGQIWRGDVILHGDGDTEWAAGFIGDAYDFPLVAKAYRLRDWEHQELTHEAAGFLFGKLPEVLGGNWVRVHEGVIQRGDVAPCNHYRADTIGRHVAWRQVLRKVAPDGIPVDPQLNVVGIDPLDASSEGTCTCDASSEGTCTCDASSEGTCTCACSSLQSALDEANAKIQDLTIQNTTLEKRIANQRVALRDLTNAQDILKADLDEARADVITEVAISAAELKLAREERDAAVAKAEAMQKHATGNAVLVRTSGFQLPVTLPAQLPSMVSGNFVAPDVRDSGFEVISFTLQPNTDGFGRAIYKEV